MRWENRLKETEIFYIISWGLPRKHTNFMGALTEKFWFHVDSGEKVNFMGFLNMAGFYWFHEIYDSHGKNAQFLSWSKFLLRPVELLFSVYICSSDTYYAFWTSSSSCSLFLWILYTSWWMHSALILRWQKSMTAYKGGSACKCVWERAWKIWNTKYSPGDFIFYHNTSLFYAV